jgi:hypothetical protein
MDFGSTVLAGLASDLDSMSVEEYLRFHELAILLEGEDLIVNSVTVSSVVIGSMSIGVTQHVAPASQVQGAETLALYAEAA